MIWNRSCKTLILLLAASLLGGCASGDSSGQGGLIVAPEGGGAAMTEEVRGLLSRADGCMYLGDEPVIWPAGTESDADGVVLPDGAQVSVGDRLQAGGGHLKLEAVRQLYGEEIANSAETCAGDLEQVVVLSTVTRAETSE